MSTLLRRKPASRRSQPRKTIRAAKKPPTVKLAPEEIALENAILQAAAQDVAALR